MPAEWLRFLKMSSTGDIAKQVGFRDLPQSMYFQPGAGLEVQATEEPRLVVSDYLNRNRLACAILNSTAAGPIAALSDPDFGAVVARATNDWLLNEWLTSDERLRGALVVTPHDPPMAAVEIRRAGSDHRITHVIFSNPACLMGHRSLHPIYEAAADVGIAVCLAATGVLSGQTRGFTALGRPTTIFEYEASWIFAAQPHLISLLSEGTLGLFPELRVMFAGFGVSWLPSVLWKLDAEAYSGELEHPVRLRGTPSQDVFERVRFVTSFNEFPIDPEALEQFLELLGCDRLVLYGSGHRRGHDASVDSRLRTLPPQQAKAIAYGNAEAFLLDWM